MAFDALLYLFAVCLGPMLALVTTVAFRPYLVRGEMHAGHRRRDSIRDIRGCLLRAWVPKCLDAKTRLPLCHDAAQQMHRDFGASTASTRLCRWQSVLIGRLNRKEWRPPARVLVAAN